MIGAVTASRTARGALARAYRRLGPRYPRTALVVTFHSQHVVLIMGVAVVALYVSVSAGRFALLAVVAIVGQEVYGAFALRYFRSRLGPVVAWLEGGRPPAAAPEAWRAAASVPLELLRQWIRGGYPFLTILAWSGFATWLLELPAYAILILFAAAAVGTTYANARAQCDHRGSGGRPRLGRPRWASQARSRGGNLGGGRIDADVRLELAARLIDRLADQPAYRRDGEGRFRQPGYSRSGGGERRDRDAHARLQRNGLRPPGARTTARSLWHLRRSGPCGAGGTRRN
jgi:hypothetical protein